MDASGQIDIRDFCADDLLAAADIMQATWYPGADTAMEAILARSDAAFYASKASHGYAAVDSEGTLAGYALLLLPGAPKADFARAMHTAHQQIQTEADTPELRRRLEQCARFAQEELAEVEAALRAFDPGSSAHFLLFVVDSRLRGQGVGSRLYQAVRTASIQHGCRRLVLVTDDDCDYGYYEHKGLQRLRSKKAGPGTGTASDFHIYVYADIFTNGSASKAQQA